MRTEGRGLLISLATELHFNEAMQLNLFPVRCSVTPLVFPLTLELCRLRKYRGVNRAAACDDLSTQTEKKVLRLDCLKENCIISWLNVSPAAVFRVYLPSTTLECSACCVVGIRRAVYGKSTSPP